MALFQRNTINDQLIKIHLEEPVAASDEGGFIKLIVGLGNLGKKYEGTRHNVGFAAIDSFAAANEFPKWQESAKFKAMTSERFMGGKKVVLTKPTTYMNESGQAVKLIRDFYKATNRDIVVVHDELDLPFGTVKAKLDGGSAGNNGIKSLIGHVGSDFQRIRIGIKNDQLEQMDPADFVLAKFSATEKKQLPKVIQDAVTMINL